MLFCKPRREEGDVGEFGKFGEFPARPKGRWDRVRESWAISFLK